MEELRKDFQLIKELKNKYIVGSVIELSNDKIVGKPEDVAAHISCDLWDFFIKGSVDDLDDNEMLIKDSIEVIKELSVNNKYDDYYLVAAEYKDGMYQGYVVEGIDL